MVTIKEKTTNETVVGKTVIDNIKTIEKAVGNILKDNLDLRRVQNRHLVKLLVEQKLGRKVADESVPRSCRAVQSLPPSGQGLWRPEEDDGREELAEIHKEYYSK